MHEDKKNKLANADASQNAVQISHSNDSTLDNEKQSHIAEAKKFFNLTFGSVKRTAFSYLWTLPDKKTYFFDVSQADNRNTMAEKAIALSDAGFDVYYGVNLQGKAPATGRGKEESITFQTAIIADIDTLGGKHTDPKKYPASFDVAKTFLPFKVSLLVNSGYGSHDYCLYQEPVEVNDETRAHVKARDKKFIDAIRANAAEFSKAVDSVGDLTRVLRVPGTRNYKLGVSDDAPVCHIVEINDLRFSPDELDAKLNALISDSQNVTKPKSTRATVKKSATRTFEQSTEFDDFRVRRMLDVLPVGYLHEQDWFTAMTAIKNLGFTYDEFDVMNQGGENYDEAKNRARWNSDTDPNIGIGALYNLAAQYGYDAKDTYHEWYNLHPTLRPSAKRNMDEDTKRELDDAIILLETLEPENFTADDARNPDNLHAVALAQTFGFNAQAENFFIVIKKAKEIARICLKDVESNLVESISEAEKNALTALVEGINIKSLRNEVDREVTEIKRAQNKFRAQQARDRAKAEAIKHARERKQTVEDNIQKLIELRAEYTKNPSPELAAQIQDLILDTCDAKISKNTGAITRIEATQKNADLIFTFDPYLDGLFGYDQFQQADVFLKPPIWNPDAKKGEEWKDRDDAQLQAYLRKTYIEFTSEKLILNSVTVYSDAHKFHEVKEFFLNLPTWDGKPRAKKLLVKFLGADDSPYVREVTLNILTAAIARIFHPGCDYQLAPILLGEQGIGKSYMLGKLFGKWYGSLVDDVGDPHAIDAIQKLWGVEIKEMAAMKKDVDANKRFIDSAKDTRRQAYARRATTIPRHCVFVITTNNKMCLTDMTGNRRYPIIVCHNKPRHYVEGLTDKYILQVWAEVFAHYNELFKNGFDEKKLELSRDAQMQSDEIAEEYLRDDGLATEIQGYLDTKILPLILWHLLTREERRKFIADGRLVIIDAISEFNHRRRARGGRQDTVQRDVDLITSCLSPSQNKHWLRIEHKNIQGNTVDEYILYGSELRQHICVTEIYTECFGNDRRKSPTRIHEVLNNLDSWHLGARIRNLDPAYPDQKKVFYRNDD